MRTVGTVKFFNSKRGFGFITPDDGSDDVFVHFQNIQMEGFKVLSKDQRVSYTPTQGAKGWQAVEVQVLSEKEAF